MIWSWELKDGQPSTSKQCTIVYRSFFLGTSISNIKKHQLQCPTCYLTILDGPTFEYMNCSREHLSLGFFFAWLQMSSKESLK